MRLSLNKELYKKAGLLCLRGTGILAKFLLTFLITKKVSLSFQGSFSLVSTSITILVLFFGLDFYIYSNKLIIKNNSKAIFYLKNNLVFYCLSYLLFVPILYIIVNFVLVEPNFSFYLLVSVIILEHLGQEFFRMYIALKRVYLANILLFIRTGLWPITLVVYLLSESQINLEINNILVLWGLSALISVIFSFLFFPNIRLINQQKTDFKWIKGGLVVASQMFIATVFLKIMEFSDRYIIDFFYNKESVGIYTFYFQLANLANVIISTIYLSFLYPKLMEKIYNGDVSGKNEIQKDIKKKALLVVIATGIIYVLILPQFLEIINRTQLYEFKFILFGLLVSTLFLNLSYSGHYALIALNKEKLIFKITLIGFFISISLNFVLIPFIGIWGAMVSQICSNFTMFKLKNRY